MKIFKYSVEKGSFWHSMPKNAKFLTVEIQNGMPYMWFMIDEKLPDEDRYFEIVGTGQLLPSDIDTYLGSFQKPPFVWHLLEVRNE